jgi:gag-polypeptide of LTR copia-type
LKKLKEDNELAFTELLLLSIDTLTPQGKIAFKCLMGTKTSEYPDGHAGNGMARLMQKYLPKSAPTLVKLHKEFYNSSTSRLKSGGDPDKWITELERIQMRMEEMGSDMTDKQFIVHVLNNLTPEYDVVVDVNHVRIDSTTNPLSIDNQRKLLKLHFEKMTD